MRLLAPVALLLVLFFPEAGFPFTGKVVAVLDGDTIDVLHNGQAERIRLNGIDCPEKKQPFGQKAKQFTSALVFGKEVTVHPKTMDRHKRTVGDVLLPDGTNVNRELVKAGLAWWYRKYSKDGTLETLEREAQEAKRGLWRDPHPVPPWEFRHPAKKNGAEPASVPSDASSDETTGMQIIGNQQSHVYHRPDCPGYTATKPKNRRMFNTEAEAQAVGYHLAGNCPQ